MLTPALIGNPAPAFTLTNFDDSEYSYPGGEKDKLTVIFFYPQANTFGCTREACQFRDAIAEKAVFDPIKLDVVGISPDAVQKQRAFVEKEHLTYPVLSDSGMKVSKLFGISQGLFGIARISRVTFVIDKKGVVRDALDSTINFGAHCKFVDKWLHKLEEEEQAAAVSKE